MGSQRYGPVGNDLGNVPHTCHRETLMKPDLVVIIEIPHYLGGLTISSREHVYLIIGGSGFRKSLFR